MTDTETEARTYVDFGQFPLLYYFYLVWVFTSNYHSMFPPCVCTRCLSCVMWLLMSASLLPWEGHTLPPALHRTDANSVPPGPHQQPDVVTSAVASQCRGVTIRTVVTTHALNSVLISRSRAKFNLVVLVSISGESSDRECPEAEIIVHFPGGLYQLTAS